MEIIFGIIIVIALFIVVGISSYKVGYNSKFREVELDNSAKIKEYQKYKHSAEIAKVKVEQIEKEYQDKKEYIDNIQQNAQKQTEIIQQKYEAEEKLLKEQYQKLQEILNRDYEINKELLDSQIKQVRQELTHLAETKAASIRAMQQEEMIKAERDKYRLDISSKDKSDIEILRTIRPQLSKPRVLDMLVWQSYFQPMAKQKFPLILGDEVVCGIYKLTNILDERAYIGQAKDMRKRWLSHCKCALGIDTPQGSKLYQAMQEAGLENFTFELLLECEADQLDKNEQYFIDLFNTVEYGYNSRNQVS